MAKPLTGGKVLAITVSAFAIIIGVNLVMAWKAIGTFPGLEVKNSYVASQVFDAERSAQNALGWSLAAEYTGRELVLTFRDRAGMPAQVDKVQALVGRPTMAQDDLNPEFRYVGGQFVAPATLAPGKWMALVEAFAPDGTRFHQRLDLYVKG